LLLLLPGAAVGQVGLPAPTVPGGLGVNIHFTDPRPGEMAMLAGAGFRWVRMDFTWAGTERKRGEYDFRAYERLLDALAAHKMRALFILDYSNKLYEPKQSVTTEAGRRAFANWAAAAAKHFKGRGILWEIWNEPNIVNFWKPKPKVEDYAALALAASQAIRQAAPDEKIIGPATSTVDLAFLEGCFKAGLLECWDAVSVHPYRQSAPETVVADYERLSRLIARYAPRNKEIPILSGEWGYSATWKGFDPDRQGKLLARQLLVNLSQDIPLSIWYDWHDDGRDPKEPEHHFGIVGFDYHEGRTPVYDAKSAYRAAQTLATTLAGYRYSKRLALASPQDFALRFVRGKQSSKLAVWTTAAKAHEIRLPSNAGVFDACLRSICAASDRA